MDKVRKIDREEARIQEAGENRLKLLGWFVKSTHGNIYQFGFPDVFCAHMKYSSRWIEFKRPQKYSFTTAQMETFPQMAAAGVGIWICTDEFQLPDILFKPPNMYQFFGAAMSGSHRG